MVIQQLASTRLIVSPLIEPLVLASCVSSSRMRAQTRSFSRGAPQILQQLLLIPMLILVLSHVMLIETASTEAKTAIVSFDSLASTSYALHTQLERRGVGFSPRATGTVASLEKRKVPGRHNCGSRMR